MYDTWSARSIETPANGWRCSRNECDSHTNHGQLGKFPLFQKELAVSPFFSFFPFFPSWFLTNWLALSQSVSPCAQWSGHWCAWSEIDEMASSNGSAAASASPSSNLPEDVEKRAARIHDGIYGTWDKWEQIGGRAKIQPKFTRQKRNTAVQGTLLSFSTFSFLHNYFLHLQMGDLSWLKVQRPIQMQILRFSYSFRRLGVLGDVRKFSCKRKSSPSWSCGKYFNRTQQRGQRFSSRTFHIKISATIRGKWKAIA